MRVVWCCWIGALVVACGARSGIAGGAAIMVSVFLAFGSASVVMMKTMGLAMSIAVAIDATIVRTLLVPAAMRLFGELNWWAPFGLSRK